MSNPDFDSNSVDAVDEVARPEMLPKLPPELLDILAGFIDSNQVLLNLRATCRTLRNATALQFCKRYLSVIKIRDTKNIIRLPQAWLTSSQLPQAQRTARTLVFSVPQRRPGHEDDQQPSTQDVTSLLVAMPNLEELELHDVADKPSHAVRAASMFIAGMTKPPIRDTIHLRSLELTYISVDEDLLASMLDSQKDSLHTVFFFSVTLTGSGTWPRVLAALRSADKMRRIQLVDLMFDVQSGFGVMLEFPKQSLRDFFQRTGVDGEITRRGVNMSPPTCVKSVLEIILQFVHGGATFL